MPARTAARAGTEACRYGLCSNRAKILGASVGAGAVGWVKSAVPSLFLPTAPPGADGAAPSTRIEAEDNCQAKPYQVLCGPSRRQRVNSESRQSHSRSCEMLMEVGCAFHELGK